MAGMFRSTTAVVAIAWCVSATCAHALEPVVIEGAVAFSAEHNLLAEARGARVERVSDNPALAHRLIDGSPRAGWQTVGAFRPGRPAQVVFRLPEERALGSVLLQPLQAYPSARMPRTVELLAARADEPSRFVFLGRYELAESARWQWLRFTGRPAAFLLLRVVSIHGSGPVGIGEVAAFAPGVDPRLRAGPSPADAAARWTGLRADLLGQEAGTRIAGVNAEPGSILVAAELELENLLRDAPLEFNPLDMTVLVEDGFYVHEPDPDTVRLHDGLTGVQRLAPGEAIRGSLLFSVPEDAGHLQLAVFTADGPVWLELTPEQTLPEGVSVLSASEPGGPVTSYVFGVERLGQTRGLRLDIGLVLNDADGTATFAFDPFEMLELRDRQGHVYHATPPGREIRHPLGQVRLHPGLTLRGQVEFSDAPVSTDYSLVLPFEEMPIVADLPPPPAAHLAREREPYERPAAASPQAARSTVPEPRETAEPVAKPEPPAADPPPAVREPTGPRRGIPDVLNTGLISIRGELLPLYGVEGLYHPYVDNFVAYIRDREVECEPAGDKGFRCLLDDADLSQVVLANGAARARADAPEHLKAAEASARTAGKGIWQ